MDPNVKDPDSTDETLPLEELDEDVRDTEPPPEPECEIIVVDDPDDYSDPDD